MDKGSQHNYKYSSMYAKSLHKIERKVKKLFQNIYHTIIYWGNMDNNQGAMMAKQSSPPPQKITDKPAELKTIDQLKATDRPADVEEKLRERARSLIGNLMDTHNMTKYLLKTMPDNAKQLRRDIESCSKATMAWTRDVTATATQIVEKFNDIQQEEISLRTR